jgi:hypothetical protein
MKGDVDGAVLQKFVVANVIEDLEMMLEEAMHP